MADARSESRQDEPHWPGWFAAIAICIRFYSRLPLPRLPGEGDLHALPDFRLVPRALPLAAIVIALPAALVMLAGGVAGINAYLAATLAITALVLTTGAFHEDGLADTADGLFGGATPERRLEIMKDSRVGSYGAMALGLSLLLRVTALAAILQAAGAWAGAAAILAAATWSRSEGVRLLASEAAARSTGASAAVGKPAMVTALIASGLALALGIGATLAADLPLLGFVIGLVLASACVNGLAGLARRLIGGQTGDIVGAAQQIAEIAIYCGFAFALGVP
jgi:adenosylcobinamide-GDP ribazoletransferase